MVVSTEEIITARADAFDVLFAPGEIVLLLGETGVDLPVGTARLHTRLILHPNTAKRLAIMLDRSINPDQHYCGRRQQHDILPIRPVNAEIYEMMNLLVDQVQGFDTPYGLERSFKLSCGSVSDNRFLFSLTKITSMYHMRDKLADACQKLKMPAPLYAAFMKKLPMGRFIHFGFEEAGKGFLFKIYIEFPVHESPGTDTAVDSPSYPLYLAFKWNPSDDTVSAVTTYTVHTGVSVAAIISKVRDIFDGQQNRVPLESVMEIVRRGAESGDPGLKPMYLEVTEEGNRRHSFDINLYDAGLSVSDIREVLVRTCAHYGIPQSQSNILLERVKEKQLGHIAGGVGRNGKDFITIYYGVERFGYSIPSGEGM